MANIRKFYSLLSALNYSKSKGHAVTVIVLSRKVKVYPSGKVLETLDRPMKKVSPKSFTDEDEEDYRDTSLPAPAPVKQGGIGWK